MRRCIAALTLLLCLLPAARAFDQAGHFYTAYALSWTAGGGRSPADRLLVAFCAQLPDMAADIDATGVYARAARSAIRSPLAWAAWARNDAVESPEVARMVTAQQLLHALTGGNAQAVQRVADETALQLRPPRRSGPPPADHAVQLCAWGFALHFLGDSRAHERLDDAGKDPAQRRMYDTGRGHFEDMHDPDYVFCAEHVAVGTRAVGCRFTTDPARRYAAWARLWKRAGGTAYDPDGFESLPEIQSRRDKVLQALEAYGAGTLSAKQRWGEDEMRSMLLSRDETIVPIRDFMNRYDGSSRSCESLLSEALTDLSALRAFAPLSCRAVWERYKAVAQQRLRAAGADVRRPLRSGRGFDAIYDAYPVPDAK